MDACGDILGVKNASQNTSTYKQLSSTATDGLWLTNKNVVTETGNAAKQRSLLDEAADVNDQLKYRRFLSEPMGDKEVSALPGVTSVAGCRLRERGYATAAKVWGKFLTLQKNQELFQIWLHDVSGASKQAAQACRRCLDVYCDIYM